MSKYTIKDIKKVNRLYDHMSQREIAEKTGIPRGTLASWSRKGWINTDTNHQKGPRKYDEETVERADRLWDVMPLPAVSEVLDIPIPTLFAWASKDWISTDVKWRERANDGKRKSSPSRAAQLVKVKGYTKQEAAKAMGVHPSTIRRYLKDYKKGAHDA
jgi:transposase